MGRLAEAGRSETSSWSFPPRSGLVVCRACSIAWGCKSPAQPDGGEVRAKRKGVAARRGLKEAWSETATRRTETGYEAARVGRADDLPRSPYPSTARVVDPAGARRRRSNLPGEVCAGSRRRD